MSKIQMTLAAIGGVIGVAVIGAGAFAYLSYAAKSAAIDGDEEGETQGLVTLVEDAQKCLKKTIFPCEKSVSELKAAREGLEAWKDEAFKHVSRGDRPVPPTSVAQFKEFMIAEAHTIADLPEGTTNKVTDAAFDFGPFKPYISEGKMPEQSELKDLQRKFDDVSTLLRMMAGSGVTKVTKLELKSAEKKEAEPEPTKRGRGKQQKKVEEPKLVTACETYQITCRMTPSALVKTLNAFAASERYIVVNDFTLALERDAIGASLAGEAKKEEATTSRRGRRRSAAVEEEQPKVEGAEAPKVSLVTDPATDSAFTAVITVSVHDFKTLEETKEEEEAK